MDQQGYPCCHNFLTVSQSYNSKNTPLGKFHAVKIAKSLFLYVFTMAFLTFPLRWRYNLPQYNGPKYGKYDQVSSVILNDHYN